MEVGQLVLVVSLTRTEFYTPVSHVDGEKPSAAAKYRDANIAWTSKSLAATPTGNEIGLRMT